MRSPKPIVASLILLVAWAMPAVACPIPVFQYALEHWTTDPYIVVVHHLGPLTEEQQAVVDMLKEYEHGEKSRIANITVLLQDHTELKSGAARDRFPQVEIRYPASSGIRSRLWGCKLDRAELQAVLDSPARQEVAKHLLARKAAVWVVLESGNAEADAKAIQTLERELPRLQTTLEVPQVAEEVGLELGDIQTEITFAIVRVRRDDPKENVFVRMLLGVEPDLKDFKDKPLVFPVYGRGRVMYAMVGEGINPRTIAAAGEFLVGPCSCQIKEDNPGVDLLLPVDWHAKVKRRTRLAVPGGAGAQDFLKRLDQLDKALDK
jgi:hypothetical protein